MLLKSCLSKPYYSATWCSKRQRYWAGRDVRRAFLDHFSNGHNYTLLPSSSLKPAQDDPSLMLVNAGMNQFKPILLGSVEPTSSSSPSTRFDSATLRSAVTCQRCIRAGGKHNDLALVGTDSTHHSFFEMLGHWSFHGHIARKDACRQALDLLLNTYNLSLSRLRFTYYPGPPRDSEPGDNNLPPPDWGSREIWRELDVPDSSIIPGTSEDNFWEMGATGPCGPSTEIHYVVDRQRTHTRYADADDSASSVKNGSNNGSNSDISNRNDAEISATNHEDLLEIWNIVFITHQRIEGGSLLPLTEEHIDTGLGLERLTAILQSVPSNYCTDLFTPILSAVNRQMPWLPAYRDRYGITDADHIDRAYRVLADHARAYTMAVTDAIAPGHRDAGFVIKSLISRSVYHVLKMGGQPKMLSGLIDSAANILGEAFPEASDPDSLDRVRTTVMDQAETAKRTLQKGRRTLGKWIGRRDRGWRGDITTGDFVKLEISNGVPHELIVELIDDHGLRHSIDPQRVWEEVCVAKKATLHRGGSAESI